MDKLQISSLWAHPDLAEPGTELEIEILGKRFAAKVLEESPYDPENAKIRA